jgi:CheY-like chemotaxis protein
LAQTRSYGVALLVEDEWLIRADMAAAFEDAGWEVEEASTGEGAIECLRNGQPIDLLVTDIQLAGYLNGWDVAEAARGVRDDFPVIYASGNPVNSKRSVAGSVFLSKPCCGSDVVKTACELARETKSGSRH